jgi:hypothetical protein
VEENKKTKTNTDRTTGGRELEEKQEEGEKADDGEKTEEEGEGRMCTR